MTCILRLFIGHQQRWGKIMFSGVSVHQEVILSTGRRGRGIPCDNYPCCLGPRHTMTAPSPSQLPLYSDSLAPPLPFPQRPGLPWTNLFNLDLTVLRPPDMFKVIHLKYICLINERLAFYWNAFLFQSNVCFVRPFEISASKAGDLKYMYSGSVR